jgi:hypothetical protein
MAEDKICSECGQKILKEGEYENTTKIDFINGGKEFEIPLIKVVDIRELQKVRAKIKDVELKDIESSVVLVKIMLEKIDKNVTKEQIENMDYATFLDFVKKLWSKNAANFRGLLPNLPATF